MTLTCGSNIKSGTGRVIQTITCDKLSIAFLNCDILSILDRIKRFHYVCLRTAVKTKRTAYILEETNHATKAIIDAILSAYFNIASCSKFTIGIISEFKFDKEHYLLHKIIIPTYSNPSIIIEKL